MPHAWDADDGRVGQLLRRFLRAGERRQRIEGPGNEKRRDAAYDGPVHGLRGSGDLPDFAAVFVEICPAAHALARYRGRIVRKRLPAGRGEFLEWAEVHGNFYATSRRWIDEQIGAGRDIVLEIDWQGAESVRLAFPAAIRIFILPPSVETLERRLRGRATDSDEVIRRRLAAARAEMRHVNEFDYVIINNELQTAVEDLAAIVRAARLSCPNQRRRYPQFFEFMEQD